MTWLRWHTVYTHWHRRTWELARDEQQRLRLWYICGWPTVSETQTNAFEYFTVPHIRCVHTYIYIYILCSACTYASPHFRVYIKLRTMFLWTSGKAFVAIRKAAKEMDGFHIIMYIKFDLATYFLGGDAGVECTHVTYNIHRYCYYFYISATNTILNIIHRHIQFGLFAQHDPFKLCVSYGNR